MKNIKIVLMAIFASTLATSCLVDDDVPSSFDESPAIIGFESSTTQASYFVDEGVVLKEYPVVLLGNGQDGSLPEQDISVTYEVGTNSTATEGEEFDFVDTSGVFTIPAGSSYALFPLNINTGGLDANEPTDLIIKLTGTTSDGAIVSDLNKSLTITFVGCQSNLEGSYNNPDAGANVTFTTNPDNPVNYMVSAMPYLTSGGNAVPFDLTDICGEIIIDATVLGSYNMVGSGVVNEDGSVTIAYALYQGGEVQFDFREEPSTYFPN